MIIVAIPVDRPGLDRLVSVVDYWSACGRCDVTLDVVYNGQLAPCVPSVFRLAVQRSTLPIATTILPSGHLSGRGPQLLAQEFLRQRVLAKGASHLLFHEVYRMPFGPAAVQHLIDADAAISGALYRDPYALGYFCVYEFQCQPREMLRYDVLPDPLPTDPIPVPGIGFGFTLIRRDVLAAVPFRSGHHAADSFFSYDARRAGFSIRACPFLVFNSKVDGDPAVLAAWHAARRGHPPLMGIHCPHRYPVDFRRRVVYEYLSGDDTLETVALRRDVPVNALRWWVTCSHPRRSE